MAEIIKYIKAIKPASWLKALLYALLIAFTYQTALKHMVFRDWAREDYSHSYLIPFVVLYLIWEKREELASIPSSPSWTGLIPFVFGIFLYWLGDLGGEYFTMYISLWFVIVGLVWLHIGWRKLKEMAFALFMMLTMFPLPQFLNLKLTFSLKLISSQLGVWMLRIFGMSAYREGNVIDLGFMQLQVVDACSGLRYLFPLLIMGVLIAYFYRAALWKRLVLVLSTIPLTIVINSLRIALTGIICSHWGKAAAEGFFHGFSGWMIFIVSFAMLVAEIWVLNRGFRGQGIGFRVGEGEKEGFKDSRGQGFEGGEGEARAKVNRSLVQPVFVVAMLLLISTFALSRGVEFREKIPSSRPFSQFPLSVGAWEGTHQTMEQKFITELDLSDYTMIDYKNGEGKHVDFYVAYYESQRKGESIHSPETCLPGSGWVFRQAGRVQVGIAGQSGSIRVNRAIMEKSGVQQISYFWFPARGRILTNAWEMKFFTFWDSLTKQRTDGALVRIITPVYGNEDVKDAEARIQEFTKQIVPVLNGFLPMMEAGR